MSGKVFVALNWKRILINTKKFIVIEKAVLNQKGPVVFYEKSKTNDVSCLWTQKMSTPFSHVTSKKQNCKYTENMFHMQKSEQE